MYMTRTNVVIDDELIAWVMDRYRLPTKREAVDFALRQLRRSPMTTDEALGMEGSGWAGDLDAIRRGTASEVAPLAAGRAETPRS